MSWVFDDTFARPAPTMGGDFDGVVDDANDDIRGDNRDRLAHQGVRNRVVVGVEPYERGFVDDRCANFVGCREMCRQGEQFGALFRQALPHALVGDRRVRSVERSCLAEPAKTIVCVGDRRRDPAGAKILLRRS